MNGNMPTHYANYGNYLLAEVLSAFDILGLGLASLASLTGGVAVAAVFVED